MEKKGDKNNGSHCCGLYCSCGRMSVGHMLVKMFVALVMVALVLAISMAIFVKFGKGMKTYHQYGIMRGQIMMQGCPFAEKGETAAMVGGGNMMFRAEKAAPAMPERMFATVVKIEGNQITIMNNAAAEQVVLSAADTMIIASSTEVGLPTLQPDMDIVVYGSVNTDKMFEAKLIQIQ